MAVKVSGTGSRSGEKTDTRCPDGRLGLETGVETQTITRGEFVDAFTLLKLSGPAVVSRVLCGVASTEPPLVKELFSLPGTRIVVNGRLIAIDFNATLSRFGGTRTVTGRLELDL